MNVLSAKFPGSLEFSAISVQDNFIILGVIGTKLSITNEVNASDYQEAMDVAGAL